MNTTADSLTRETGVRSPPQWGLWWLATLAIGAAGVIVGMVIADPPQEAHPITEIELPPTTNYGEVVAQAEQLRGRVLELEREAEELRAALLVSPEDLAALQQTAAEVPELQASLDSAREEARRHSADAARHRAALSRAVLELNRRQACASAGTEE